MTIAMEASAPAQTSTSHSVIQFVMCFPWTLHPTMHLFMWPDRPSKSLGATLTLTLEFYESTDSTCPLQTQISLEIVRKSWKIFFKIFENFRFFENFFRWFHVISYYFEMRIVSFHAWTMCSAFQMIKTINEIISKVQAKMNIFPVRVQAHKFTALY